MTEIGSVETCWRYPVKSMQGFTEESLTVGESGVEGDRRWALLDAESGRLATAKRYARLLEATAHNDRIELPDGSTVRLDNPAASEVLSNWFGRAVRLAQPQAGEQVIYEMTFDPANDDAALVDIPSPTGTFLDLGHLHLITTATLHGCATAYPDLDWDVRRFRPNLVLAADGDAFVEQTWVGRQLQIGGDVIVDVLMPTVRCAMPLRAQPAAGGSPELDREPGLYQALNDLNTVSPNHLGVYANVVQTGVISRGDAIELIDG